MSIATTNPGPAQVTPETVISLTPAAIVEVKRLIAEEDGQNLFLRIGLASGGCS